VSASTTQPLSSGEFCKLRYDTVPVKTASANVSLCTNSSIMPNFELWHSCRKWATWRWLVKFTSQPIYLKEIFLIPVGCEVGWAPYLVWTLWQWDKSLSLPEFESCSWRVSMLTDRPWPWGRDLALLLFSPTHYSVLKLIVRSGLDVPTFATRRLYVCHHARAPSGGRWNCGREMSDNFA